MPNGGYALAIAIAGMQREATSHADPLTVTAHYLRPTEPGPATVHTDVLKVGRSYTTISARLVQADKQRLQVLGTFGALSDEPALHARGAPPDIDDSARPTPDIGHSIIQRFDTEITADSVAWSRGQRGPGLLHGRVRFRDGRPPDVPSLPLFADALVPPVFNVIGPGWVPTIELTVHIRARPVPGWLTCQFQTRFIASGLLEEDGELWDADGNLVAMSRQLAALRR